MISLRAALPLTILLVAGCARDPSERPPQQPPAMYPPMAPGPGPAPAEATQPPKTINIRRPGRPRTDPTLGASATLTSSAAPLASASAVPPVPPPAELFRAQDACLDRCDQFACMKIAEAYRTGIGVPVDILAGRRYAIHACSECGAQGLAIVDQCPSWGVGPDTKKKH